MNIGRLFLTQPQLPRASTRNFCRLAAARAISSLLLFFSLLRLAFPQAQPSSDKFFRELRSRQLFSVAEGYCLHRLTAKNLSPALRMELTLELARSQTEHALYVGEQEAVDLRAKARAELEEALRQDPQTPRGLFLEAEEAFISASAGNAFRWQALLSPHDAGLAQQAKKTLGIAISGLRDIEPRLAAQLRKPFADRDDPLIPQPYELRGLLVEVRLRLGRALLDLSHLLGPQDPLRVATLQDVEKLLRSLSDVAAIDERAAEGSVLLAECYRLKGESHRALSLLEAVAARPTSQGIREQLLAERIRTLLQLDKPRDAQALFTEDAQANQRSGGEVLFAKVQMLHDLWQKSQNKRQTSQAVAAQMEKLVDQLAQEVGGPWTYRGQLLLDQMKGDQKFGADVAPLVRKAQTAYGHRQIAEAVIAFEQAATAARKQGQPDLAFQLGFQRASIQAEAKQWDAAAKSFAELAEEFPTQPKADQAHLLAAFARGKLYEEEPTQPRFTEYAKALAEHLQKYAMSPTAVEATWLLAQLEERHERFPEALQLYRGIPANHPRRAAAQVAIARCHEQFVRRMHGTQQPTEAAEKEAITELEKFLTDPGQTADTLDEAHAEIALHLARILLQQTTPDFEEADRLLTHVFATLEKGSGNSDSSSPDFVESRARLRAQATQMRVISLAGQGRAREAHTLLNQLSATSPAELLRILDGLSVADRNISKEARRDLGELQLQAAEQLDKHRAKLPPTDQRRLDECLAAAYLATAQPKLAVDLYENLLKKSPRDPQLLTAYVAVLDKCGTKACLEKSLAALRALESLAAPGTDEWLERRYRVCRSLFDLQEISDCKKLLAVTRLLYPKLGGATLRERFIKLEALCTSMPAKQTVR